MTRTDSDRERQWQQHGVLSMNKQPLSKEQPTTNLLTNKVIETNFKNVSIICPKNEFIEITESSNNKTFCCQVDYRQTEYNNFLPYYTKMTFNSMNKCYGFDADMILCTDTITSKRDVWDYVGLLL